MKLLFTAFILSVSSVICESIWDKPAPPLLFTVDPPEFTLNHDFSANCNMTDVVSAFKEAYRDTEDQFKYRVLFYFTEMSGDWAIIRKVSLADYHRENGLSTFALGERHPYANITEGHWTTGTNGTEYAINLRVTDHRMNGEFSCHVTWSLINGTFMQVPSAQQWKVQQSAPTGGHFGDTVPSLVLLGLCIWIGIFKC